MNKISDKEYKFLKSYIVPYFDNAPIIKPGSILKKVSGEWRVIGVDGNMMDVIFHSIEHLKNHIVENLTAKEGGK